MHSKVDEISEEFVHDGLERGGSIGQAEGHDDGFEVSEVCAECCLPFVAFSDSDEVVGASQIQLGEVISTFELV